MKNAFLKFGVKASLLVYGIVSWTEEAFAVDSEDYIGAGSSAPEYGGDSDHDAAYAAEHAGEYADGAHKATSGLPQMDTTWFPSQVFWLAVTFFCLYVIFSRKVLPEISVTLENRRTQIEGDLENAQELKEEAEKVHQAYEEILDEARKKSSDAFKKVDESIKKKSNEKLEKFRERAADENAKTEKLINDAKNAAMEDMESTAAEVASVAAEKIVGISTDINKAKDLVKNIGKKAA